MVFGCHTIILLFSVWCIIILMIVVMRTHLFDGLRECNFVKVMIWEV